MTRKNPVAGGKIPGMKPRPEAVDSLVEPTITARPDGYYWCASDGKQEFGPFASVELARADLEAADGQAPEPGETLQEAESELGIADWIDPETGELAQGLSPPHLDER